MKNTPKAKPKRKTSAAKKKSRFSITARQRNITLVVFGMFMCGVAGYILANLGSAATDNTSGSYTLTRPVTDNATRFNGGSWYYINKAGATKVNLKTVADTANTSVVPCSLPTYSSAGLTKLPVKQVFCWQAADSTLTTTGSWKAQGISGSAMVADSAPYTGKNLLLVSWYHKDTSGNGDGKSRISVVDVSRSPATYKHIRLVSSCSSSGCSNLNTHAGGLAWTGRYVYMADTDAVLVFDTEAIFRLPSGEYVMPVYGKWNLARTTVCTGVKSPLVSSLSVDTSTSPAQLVTQEYVNGDSDCGGKNVTDVIRWNLTSSGAISASTTTSGGKEIKTAKSDGEWQFTKGDPRHINGGTAYKGKTFLNDSYQTEGSQSDIDVMHRYSSSMSLQKDFRMPPLNVEGMYVDAPHDSVWTLTEGSTSLKDVYVFSYSLSQAYNN